MRLYQLFILSFILVSCNAPKKEIDNSQKTEEKLINIPKNQVLTPEQQIASAVMAAPAEAREKAMIYGYNATNELVVLREGTNDFICIADNPKKDGFQVVAYHRSLEPYMSRSRALNAEGKSRQEKEQIRSSEAESGVLKMPENPATLHLLYGENGFYNMENDSIENVKYRYVVYIPYATQESTGLGLSPNTTGHPWLMFPGAYNAHIMITPVN